MAQPIAEATARAAMATRRAMVRRFAVRLVIFGLHRYGLAGQLVRTVGEVLDLAVGNKEVTNHIHGTVSAAARVLFPCPCIRFPGWLSRPPGKYACPNSRG